MHPTLSLQSWFPTAAAAAVVLIATTMSIGACSSPYAENQETSSADLSSGALLAYWTFDEGGQAVGDAAGHGYTGWLGTTSAVETSDPARVAGKIGSALAFDGASKLVTITGGTSPKGLASTSSFTYAAWIKPSGWGGGGYGRIVSGESAKGFDDHYLYVSSASQTLGVRVADSSGGHDTTAASSAIVLNAWQHVAITYDDRTDRKAHLYINGSEVKTYATQPAASGTLAPPTSAFSVGNRLARDRGFAGTIDEVHVYGVALGAADIAQLAAATTTFPPTTSPTDAGTSDVGTTDAGTTTTTTTTTTSLAACPPATAATRWVSTTGSDESTGSASSPFRTIQHAADVANPGDVIHVNAGTYTGATSPLAYIRRSGTLSAPIVFCSEQPLGAKLDGQNTLSTGFFLEGAYVQVLGFDVSKFTGAGASIWNTGGVLVGNRIHDIGHVCTDTDLGKVGIYTEASNATIVGNVIHTIGRLSPGEQGCSPTNTAYQNHDHGLYIESSTNITVANNIFYDNTHGWAIHVYSSSGPGSSGLTIVNNTFAFPNPYRQGHVLFASPSVTSSIVENNVFYQPQTEGVRLTAPTLSNITIRNNVTTGAVTTTTSPSGGGTLVVSGNYDNTDAKLISPSTFDFHLQATSPAIDHGLAQGGVKTDIEGTPRPQGAAFDIGAYERR